MNPGPSDISSKTAYDLNHVVTGRRDWLGLLQQQFNILHTHQTQIKIMPFYNHGVSQMCKKGNKQLSLDFEDYDNIYCIST